MRAAAELLTRDDVEGRAFVQVGARHSRASAAAVVRAEPCRAREATWTSGPEREELTPSPVVVALDESRSEVMAGPSAPSLCTSWPVPLSGRHVVGARWWARPGRPTVAA